MQEISLNILDIAQNSIKAGARLVSITVEESQADNQLVVCVEDDGCGMTPEQVQMVTNPFYTTRTTRKVGLGVPFFKMAAEMTGGSFQISSEPGRGTVLKAVFVYNSIDRMPLGNMAETMVALIQCNPDIDFVFHRGHNGSCYVMDTREFRQVLEGVSLSEVPVLQFIKEYITEHDEMIQKGVN